MPISIPCSTSGPPSATVSSLPNSVQLHHHPDRSRCFKSTSPSCKLNRFSTPPPPRQRVVDVGTSRCLGCSRSAWGAKRKDSASCSVTANRDGEVESGVEFPGDYFELLQQFFPEANEVEFARRSAFEGTALKLDYLTKPSFFEDFGFITKVKMTDRVKPDDKMFLVAYPYFNVNGKLC
ncbi:hypothetical protein B296_00036969 [Ensete ventricosum]|uniref:DUF1995 domain-containing protein n=1 Tax=Ensete ventricosum TaxID=4639 RepID=A0A426XX96_ENSVE|nr:hypothetical protein B296_00036969 [Ensete ventricosum]